MYLFLLLLTALCWPAAFSLFLTYPHKHHAYTDINSLLNCWSLYVCYYRFRLVACSVLYGMLWRVVSACCCFVYYVADKAIGEIHLFSLLSSIPFSSSINTTNTVQIHSIHRNKDENKKKTYTQTSTSNSLTQHED